MQTFQVLSLPLLLLVAMSGCVQENTWEITVRPLGGDGVMYFVSGDNYTPIYQGTVIDTTVGEHKTIRGNKNLTIEMGCRYPGPSLTIMTVKKNGITVFDSEKLVSEGEAWTVKL